MSNWIRPESVPFPSTWRTFQRKDSNGVEKTFWIQDVTEEYRDDFLNIVAKDFMKDEVICKSLNFIDDTESVNEYLKIWEYSVDQKLGLICLTKNDKGDVEVVGGNCTTRSDRIKENNISLEFKGKAMRRLVSAVYYVKDLKDLFTTLNVESFLVAAGLYVLPKFRGQGIAVEILKSRRELCSAVGIDVSATIFTSTVSQKCAEKAGFKDFAEETYEELKKKNPDEWSFPGVSKTTRALKHMYIDFRDKC